MHTQVYTTMVPTNAHTGIYNNGTNQCPEVCWNKLTYTMNSYMFPPIMWPSSGIYFSCFIPWRWPHCWPKHVGVHRVIIIIIIIIITTIRHQLGLNRPVSSSSNSPLKQCFSTAGPWPSTGPWHQLYRAARGSPGICHFSFLSIFHE